MLHVTRRVFRPGLEVIAVNLLGHELRIELGAIGLGFSLQPIFGNSYGNSFQVNNDDFFSLAKTRRFGKMSHFWILNESGFPSTNERADESFS